MTFDLVLKKTTDSNFRILMLQRILLPQTYWQKTETADRFLQNVDTYLPTTKMSHPRGI